MTPTKSGPGVACTYEVTYKDADGDAPTLLQVHILGSNGQEVAVRDLLPVNPDDTAYKTGVRYRVTTTAVNGPDVYCFYRRRGQGGTATFPTGVNPTDVAGTYAAYAALGPVINQAPALSDGTVSRRPGRARRTSSSTSPTPIPMATTRRRSRSRAACSRLLRTA